MKNHRNKGCQKFKATSTKKNFKDIAFNSTYNEITFYRLNHQKVVSKFIIGLKEAISKGNKDFELDFSNIHSQCFPNAIVPLCGILDYYRENGVEFIPKGLSLHLSNMGLFSPSVYRDQHKVLNKLWPFSKDNIHCLVDAFINDLSRSDKFPKDFLNATEWTLNEVMDNVIVHSKTDTGYVMGQIHKTSHHIAFTVFDMGQGIFNSFKGSEIKPKDDVEAICLALQESVTRDKKLGQGNGLFGLSSVIKQGDSRLKITSGKGYYSYNTDGEKTYNNCPVISNDIGMTSIDFMLDYSSNLSFNNLLVFNGKEYPFQTLRIENLEDDKGNIRIKIIEKSNGTGTRYAAEQIKNEILNILIEQPKIIILDFYGTSVISSSYADELIAKLLCDLGLFQFNKLIRIDGLSNEQQLILQKSVIQRIVENYTEDQVKKG